MSRTVIVVGATGFIGRNLCRAAAERGLRVIGVSRSGDTAVEGCERVIALDGMDRLAPLPADTALFHVAAARYDATRFQDMQVETLNANAELATRIYAFCAAHGIREVRLASSSGVYPAGVAVMDDAVPLDLNAPPHKGEAFYAWSKRWSEIVATLYAERFGISTVAFRLSNPYGPFDSTDLKAAHVAPAFVMKALSDSPSFELLGNPDAERDFIYAGDVADVFLRSLDWQGRSDVFNLCTGETTSMRVLAETALKAAGADKPIVLAGTPGGIAVRRLTADRLRAAFGIERFTPLLDGLTKTAEWYRHALRS